MIIISVSTSIFRMETKPAEYPPSTGKKVRLLELEDIAESHFLLHLWFTCLKPHTGSRNIIYIMKQKSEPISHHK
jgi:hypothetical protein